MTRPKNVQSTRDRDANESEADILYHRRGYTTPSTGTANTKGNASNLNSIRV